MNALTKAKIAMRPIVIGCLVFIVAALAMCSFETTLISALPASLWILAGTLGFLSCWASWYFNTASVIAAVSVALVSAYLILKVTNGTEKALSLAVFASSFSGLLIFNRHQILAIIVLIGGLVYHLLQFPPLSNIALSFPIALITCAASYYVSWFLKVIVEGELEPTFSNLVLARVFSFLGVYLLCAISFALIYHLIYIHDKTAFRVIPELATTKLDLSYFIYWSFGVFVTFGPGEVAPANPLCRSLIVLQFFLGISWLTVFFSVFSQRLSKSH